MNALSEVAGTIAEAAFEADGLTTCRLECSCLLGSEEGSKIHESGLSIAHSVRRSRGRWQPCWSSLHAAARPMLRTVNQHPMRQEQREAVVGPARPPPVEAPRGASARAAREAPRDRASPEAEARRTQADRLEPVESAVPRATAAALPPAIPHPRRLWSKIASRKRDCALVNHKSCGTIVIAVKKGTEAAFTPTEATYHSCVPGCDARGCFHADMAEDLKPATSASQKIVAVCTNKMCARAPCSSETSVRHNRAPETR